MRRIISIILLFISILLFAKLALAQTATTSAVRLSFPIAELGNCRSAQDCKTYCDDPTHLDACIAYAKAKGFYHESTLDTNQQVILSSAESTFGCTSLASCREYCQDSTHEDACMAFAKIHNLPVGSQTTDTAILVKAETLFGCTGIDSCRAFCSNEANKTKCAAFAKENGLEGGNRTVGPGGCMSEDSCKTFCSNPTNFSVCSSFMQAKIGSGSGERRFTGPGGCTSEATCRVFCNKNPAACHMGIGHEDGINASDTARPEMTVQEENGCAQHPGQCQPFHAVPSGMQDTPPLMHNGQPNQELRQGQDAPQFQLNQQVAPGAGPSAFPHTTPPEGQNGNPSHPPLPSPSLSPTGAVQGVATQQSFFDWLVGQIMHVH